MIKSKKQILLTGCYRSGTDITTMYIGNHPNLSATMDTNFIRYCLDRFDPIEHYWRKALETMEKAMKTRWDLSLDVNTITKECFKAEKVTYALLYDLIMSTLYLHDDVNMWLDKTQLGWRHIPDFLKMFPEGKAIIVIRHPYSVLASFKKLTYAPKPLYLGAIFNCFDSMKHAEMYETQYSDRFIKVRYEDLMFDKENTLVKIYRKLGLTHFHKNLTAEKWTDTRGDPWTLNTSFPPKTGKFDPIKNMDTWKTVLEDWEISFCNKINYEFMIRNRYEMSGNVMKSEEPDTDIFTDRINGYLKNWLLKNEGIQEFPTDPLNPENWTVNK